MKASTGRSLRHLRLATLIVTLVCFTALFLLVRRPVLPLWASRGIFFALDPLIFLERLAATRTILVYGLVAMVPLALTLVFGRFFCGWVCPFGAIHEFTSWVSRKRWSPHSGPPWPRLRFKYLVLTIVVVAALAGTTLGGWLDPFALLTRSAATVVDPAIASAFSQLIPQAAGRVSMQPVLIGSIFLLVIALNAWKQRFFCNTLCPLGALYGLPARFSLMRFETATDCQGCRLCSFRCSYDGGPGKDYLKSECVACMACVEDCPRENVQVKFGWPKRALAPGLDLSRRRLLGSATLGVAVAALPKAALETHPQTKAGHGFLRPPGAVAEDSFLASCVRCNQCVEACPTSFIQPAEWEAGWGGIWTPVLNAQAGYCKWECDLCTRACPTGALQPLTLPAKQAFKVGTAAIDRNRCFTYADGFNCTVCVEKCPVPTKPLRFRPVETLDFRGIRVKIQQVYVVPNLCTGCGICEHFCPRSGAPGITIASEDEDRQAVSIG